MRGRASWRNAWRIGLVAAAVFFATLRPQGPALAQTANPDLWATDPYGSVQAIERTPTTIYLAGSFRSVGPVTGQGLPTQVSTGAPFATYPRVSGNVEVVLADGERGWFIGGSFDRVGDEVRKNLAYVFADGRVSSWAPDPDGTVWALTLSQGTLYVGGFFSNIAGSPRSGAAAIELRWDRLLDWNPDVEGGWVRAIAVDGSRVYLGGYFRSVGGQPRSGLAAVDRATGVPTQWNPAGNASEVFAIEIEGQAVYVGGQFYVMDGQLRALLAAFDRLTNDLLPWSWVVERIPECNHCDNGPFVRALAVADGRLYLGGSFTHVDGIARAGLAAINLTTHTLTAWDAQATGVPPYPYVYALAVHRGVVYAGGDFHSLGGVRHAYVGAVDAESGLATEWFPMPNGEVHALATTDRAIYVGGEFTSAWSWRQQNGLAALDARTGALLPWSPNPNAEVTAMKLQGNTVYVAGAFSKIDDLPRHGIAALDAATGHATPWNPSLDAGLSRAVWAMAMLNGTLYVGGHFYGVGGEPRSNLAAIDSVSGRVNPWNPSVGGGFVTGLVVQGDTLFIGGGFLTVGGKSRVGLAAVDTSGAVLAWHPIVAGDVSSLLLADGRLIAGGVFAETLGVWRIRIAEFDPQSGARRRWLADVDYPLFAMAYANDVLYVGAPFTTIGGQARHGLAALDIGTGTVLDWDPQQDGTISALQATEDAVYVGGAFSHIAHDARSGLAMLTPAALPDSSSPVVVGAGLALAQNAPNPANGSTLVRFTMGATGPVSLSIYDLAGRCIARPLRDELLRAGPQEVAVRTDQWAPGVYYYRVTSGALGATRKMVVIR